MAKGPSPTKFLQVGCVAAECVPNSGPSKPSFQSSPTPKPAEGSNSLPASRTKREVAEIARSLDLDAHSTQTLTRFVSTRKREKNTWPELAEASLGVRMSRAVGRLTEEEGRFFLRLLERGDFRVLSPKKRERDFLMQSGHTEGLGRTAIKRASGNVVKNKAQKAADLFVDNAGGMRQVILWLEAVEGDASMPTAIQNLLALARKAPHKKLSRLLAETGASHGQLVKWALTGATLVGDAERAMELRKGENKAVQNLVRISQSGMGACPECQGARKLKVPTSDGKEVEGICPVCNGDGKEREHPEVLGAIRLLAEATGLVKTKGAGDTNLGVAVKVEAGGSSASAQKFFEHQMEVMDKVRMLPPGKMPEQLSAGVVDAEVVPCTVKE